MPTAKEQREENTRVAALLTELIAIRDKQRAATPGQPAVEISLEKILTFAGEDGTRRAVIELSELIYLVEQILRR